LLIPATESDIPAIQSPEIVAGTPASLCIF
jgi:hypothetical protein